MGAEIGAELAVGLERRLRRQGTRRGFLRLVILIGRARRLRLRRSGLFGSRMMRWRRRSDGVEFGRWWGVWWSCAKTVEIALKVMRGESLDVA